MTGAPNAWPARPRTRVVVLRVAVDAEQVPWCRQNSAPRTTAFGVVTLTLRLVNPPDRSSSPALLPRQRGEFIERRIELIVGE